MSECLHERIDTYRFIDTGEPCGLWACAECKKKFIPADSLIAIEQQRDELLAAAENLTRVKGRHHTEHAYKALEAAIAKVKP